MPERRDRKRKRVRLPRFGGRRLLHHIARRGHGGKTSDHDGGDLEIRIEFELNIEEGEDPVMNETLGDIEQDAWAILDQGGQDIVETAQDIVHVKTGALMMSIYYEVAGPTGLVIGASVPYAGFQEYGTVYMAPNSFLRPAIAEHQPMIQAELDDMIAQNLSKDTSEADPEFEFNNTMEELEEAAIE